MADNNQNLSKGQIILYLSIAVIVIIFMANKDSLFHSSPKQPDKVLFLNFYRQTMQACAPIDQTYRPFADAMGQNQWLNAAKIAKQIKVSIHEGWYNLTLIQPPELQNKDAGNKLREGKETLDSAYFHKNKIIETYLDLIKNPSGAIDTGSDLLNSSEKVQQRMISGLLLIFDAGQKIGVSSEEMKKF